jgi:prepilin peptidase CpaA
VPAGLKVLAVQHTISAVSSAVSLCEIALTLIGLALLLFAALHDFAVRTVPNYFSVLLILSGAALRLLGGGVHALEWGAFAAGTVFALTFIFWRLGWMGGGDVKLLAAAALFVPPILVPMMIASTALAGGVLAVFFVIGRRLARRPQGARPLAFIPRILRCEQWRLHRGGPLPYAAAIAAGGLIATLYG